MIFLHIVLRCRPIPFQAPESPMRIVLESLVPSAPLRCFSPQHPSSGSSTGLVLSRWWLLRLSASPRLFAFLILAFFSNFFLLFFIFDSDIPTSRRPPHAHAGFFERGRLPCDLQHPIAFLLVSLLGKSSAWDRSRRALTALSVRP